MEDVQPIIVLGGTIFETVGVAVLMIGSLLAFAQYVADLIHREPAGRRYRALRRGLAKAIMLGLEFLVAADIVRSVAVDPTFQSVGVLALIVAVRTFLSWSLEVEITGTWPWRRASRAATSEAEAEL